MKKEIETMISQSEAIFSTYVWLVIYGAAVLVFFSISVWVIIRGGKDVLEILTDSEKKQ